MDELKDYYQVLKVSPVSSQQTIRNAYRHLVKKHHPDRGGNQNVMVLINEAYAVLSDPEKRKQYDSLFAVLVKGPSVYEVDARPDPSANRSSPKTVSPQLRPWARLAARLIDTLSGAVLGLSLLIMVLSFFLPGDFRLAAKLSQLSGPASLVLIVLIWCFLSSFVVLIEAAALSAGGSTLGKWLLRIHVFDLSQQRITFQKALRRSFSVWFRGTGCGIPVLCFITMAVSYNRLVNLGLTVWDEAGDYFVAHREIDPLRFTAACLLILLLGFSFFQLCFGHFVGF